MAVLSALKAGWTPQRVHELSAIDPWFIDQFKQLVEFEDRLMAFERLEDVPREVLAEAKQLGYSDPQLAMVFLGSIRTETILQIRTHRKSLGVYAAEAQVPHLRGAGLFF